MIKIIGDTMALNGATSTFHVNFPIRFASYLEEFAEKKKLACTICESIVTLDVCFILPQILILRRKMVFYVICKRCMGPVEDGISKAKANVCQKTTAAAPAADDHSAHPAA